MLAPNVKMMEELNIDYRAHLIGQKVMCDDKAVGTIINTEINKDGDLEAMIEFTDPEVAKLLYNDLTYDIGGLDGEDRH